LTAFIKKGENKNRSLAITESYRHLENFLYPIFSEQEKSFHIKELMNKQRKMDVRMLRRTK